MTNLIHSHGAIEALKQEFFLNKKTNSFKYCLHFDSDYFSFYEMFCKQNFQKNFLIETHIKLTYKLFARL